jgi:flagellar biosynthetic protein FliQ
MSIDSAITLIQSMLFTALIVGAPVILTAFVVGVLISIFQAATQIQEMTLTFIPKIVATIIAMIIFGSWMFIKIVDYTRELFQNIVTMLT